MSKERLAEIHELMYTLERRMKPLEWDLSKKQINEFQRVKLERYKKEHSELVEEKQGLTQ
ncbi:TPA: hypothetical protein HA278_01720 [Candidatus Woesearchaeota archaeon]|nr:hypothetical protein [Candidatus Woesearchaeota archaeon]